MSLFENVYGKYWFFLFAFSRRGNYLLQFQGGLKQMEEAEKNPSFGSADQQPAPQGEWSPKTKFGAFIDRYFHIGERGSSIVRELVGGLITFLAMFYILNVNSGILSNWFSGFISEGAHAGEVWVYGDVYLPAASAYAGIFIATALSAGITTIAMGLIGKLPVGLASGMGINSMIAGYLASSMGFNYAQMMCLVFIDGILFLIISVTPLRSMIVRAIPKNIKIAISAGIGFFIAYLGMKTSGILSVSDNGLAMGNLKNVSTLITLIGVILVLALSALPKQNKVCAWISRFSVIIVMLVLGIVEASLGQAGVGDVSAKFLLSSQGNWNNFGTLVGACFHGFDIFANPQAYALVFTLLFIDFFDTTGTLVGVEVGAGMVDKEGNITVSDRNAMIVDAGGTVLGSIFGTTTVTSFVESTSGVAAGARTGLAALFTGLLFSLSVFIYPALGMFSGNVPNIALIYVGICMFMNLKELDWHDWVAIASGFMTIIMMICTASISDGIAFGFISYTVCTLAAGRYSKKDIPVTVLAAAFCALYIMEFATGIK